MEQRKYMQVNVHKPRGGVKTAKSAFTERTPDGSDKEEYARLKRNFSIFKRDTDATLEEMRSRMARGDSSAQEDSGETEEISQEQLEAAVKQYFDKNPLTIPAMSADTLGGAKVGDNLKMSEDGHLSVDTADTAEEDNTKPITAAAVHVVLGNIEAILDTI